MHFYQRLLLFRVSGIAGVLDNINRFLFKSI